MESDRPTPSRRTVLRCVALSALTTAAFLSAAEPVPALAAAPDRPEPRPEAASHLSYAAIVGLL